ncbi:VOC family protein, partial [Telluria sp. Tellsp99]
PFYFSAANLVSALLPQSNPRPQQTGGGGGAPRGGPGTTLLLAKASKPEQVPFVGNQAGGRVFLFLNTDDFWRDYERLRGHGVHFVRDPKEEDYGTVAVFADLYGNLWDLLQLRPDHPIAARLRVYQQSDDA